jgi:hypothetical protein
MLDVKNDNPKATIESSSIKSSTLKEIPIFF